MSEDRFRNYTGTDFVCDEEWWTNLCNKERVKYAVFGRETCPETGRKHLQFTICFTNARSVEKVRQLFDGRHIQISRNVDDCIKYCKKGNDCWEHGTCPKQGRRTDIEAMAEMVKAGSNDIALFEANPTLFCMYRKSFDHMRSQYEVKRNWKTEVFILTGPSGCGKTRYAMENKAVPLSVSGDTSNPFIMGYNGEDIVLFDEFHPTKMNRSIFLQLTDRYPMNINIKGGSRNWKPDVIFFTTNDPEPERWYDGAPEYLRRVKIVRMGHSDTEVVTGNTSAVTTMELLVSKTTGNAFI